MISNSRKLRVGFLVSALLIISAVQILPQGIHELIRPVRLTAGVPDTLLVSDLFYADKYKVKFEKNNYVSAEYSRNNKKLVLTAGNNFEGMALLNFKYDNKEYELPVISEIPHEYTFNYTPEGKPKTVNLFGNFNGWNRDNLPMKDKNGTYSRTVRLEPGRYQYKFFVDGKEILDPSNSVSVPNGLGGFNSLINIKPRHTGKFYLHILGKSVQKDKTGLSFYMEDQENKKPIAKSDLIALEDNELIPGRMINIKGNRIDVSLTGRDLKKHITLRVAVNRDGRLSNIQTVIMVNGKPAGFDKQVTPQDQIIYAILVDRFYDGDKSNDNPVVLPGLSVKANYQGGDLKGIIDKLKGGYFDSLGVNTLWLSPVVDNPDSAYKETPPPHRLYTGYHGYWPLHSYKVEEHFGNMKLLKELVADAHKHGMKVLLDYVAHHVFIKNPIYTKHRDWFGSFYLPDGRMNLRLWDEERLTTWFDSYLPTFDYIHSKAAREAMTDNAVWWIKETGADGFRHDAVKHVPNVFWRLLTKKLKREIEIPEHKNLYQIGETFGSYGLVSSYINNGQLNAQFNFNVYDVAIPTFLKDNSSFTALDEEIHKSFSVYGVNNLMGNIMDSHDKVRFMAFADGEVPLDGDNASEIGWKDPPQVKHESSYEKLKLYLSYLLTTPGIPVIDYGDEFGMTGAADPDNRRMMRFGNQLTEREKETLNDVRKIIKLRDDNPALRYGDYQTLAADSSCYVYLRSDMNERVLVALNKSAAAKELDIKLPSIYKLTGADDLINGVRTSINNNILKVTVPPIGSRILKLE